MRALRVVGLGIDGRTVILETVAQRSGERRERFTLPADEGLHAAVRGDLPRLGQIEIELESQMRPREIQARIRAGASVEQVATAAGVPTQRIERFAYPVLLERSRTAQLAQQAHPVRSDGPDVRTLEDVVGETFAKRGHDYDAVTWDSWRGENGKWVVQLRWRAGRSDNKAHWTFHPGAHGGTVTAIDDHATDLIDPQPAAQLRPVAPVTTLNPVVPDTPTWEPREAPPRELRESAPREVREPAPYETREPAAREFRESAPREIHEPAAREVREPAGWERPLDEPPTPAEHRDPLVAEEHGARAVPDDGPPYRPAERAGERPSAERPSAERRDPPPQDTPPTQAPTTPKRTRKDRPKVPSWEDVLLGVRSPRE